MTDSANSGQQSQPEPAPAAAPATVSGPAAGPTGATAPLPAAEIEKGKLFAVLSYACNFAGLPFWIVPIVMRDNAFSLFHGKQVMMMWLALLVVYVVGAALTAVCIGPFIILGAWIAAIILNIMGLMSVSRGEMKPMPVIGRYAEEWFKGITLQTPPAAGGR
jgi:uncharacterized membrane protein